MHYQLEFEIKAPRGRVVGLFLDPANLQLWQPDLVNIEQIGSGEPRAVGAKSKQIHRMGRREVELLETITVYNPPEQFAATYEGEGVWNLISNRFTESTGGTTRWVLDAECKFSGLMLRLMAWVLPGMIKTQTQTFMQRFKEFAEKSVNDGK